MVNQVELCSKTQFHINVQSTITYFVFTILNLIQLGWPWYTEAFNNTMFVLPKYSYHVLLIILLFANNYRLGK